MLPHQDAESVSHLAIDIGGSLIKIVCFLPDEPDNLEPDSPVRSRHTGGTSHKNDHVVYLHGIEALQIRGVVCTTQVGCTSSSLKRARFPKRWTSFATTASSTSRLARPSASRQLAVARTNFRTSFR